jgi:hypothetical protein
MRIHAVWNTNRVVRGVIGLRAVEWLLLLLGLAALDTYIWISTSSILYQAYADWAFDQQLRALTPSLGGFVGDEVRSLFGRERPRVESTEMPAKIWARPSAKPLENNPARSVRSDRTFGYSKSAPDRDGSRGGRRGDTEPGSWAHPRNRAAGKNWERRPGWPPRYILSDTP